MMVTRFWYNSDILTYSKNEEEHVEHLRLNLKFLKNHKLYARFVMSPVLTPFA